jgi:phosphoglycerate dehydrogenase-like enzyme
VQQKEKEMTKVWGAASTTDDVLSGIDLHGKRILVTGVSAGIGVETARALAAHGAQVTFGDPVPPESESDHPIVE